MLKKDDNMKNVAYELQAEFEDSHFWFVGREEICLSLIDTIMHNSIKRILDYGCGTGQLLEKLQKTYKEKEIYGIDISDKALDYCRRKGLSNVFNLKEVEPQANFFDLVICLDVLEHVRQDVKLLIQIRKLLRNGGQVLITVPAYEFLWSGEDYVSSHVRRYTRRILHDKIIQARFQISKISYFNTFLFLPLLFVLLGKRVFYPKTMYTSDVQHVNSFVSKVLTILFASERLFLKYASFPFGASIIAIARKVE